MSAVVAPGRWITTGWNRAELAVFAASVVVLSTFSVVGYGFASVLLAALVGLAAGEVFAYPSGYTFRRGFAIRFGRWSGTVAF